MMLYTNYAPMLEIAHVEVIALFGSGVIEDRLVLTAPDILDPELTWNDLSVLLCSLTLVLG